MYTRINQSASSSKYTIYYTQLADKAAVIY